MEIILLQGPSTVMVYGAFIAHVATMLCAPSLRLHALCKRIFVTIQDFFQPIIRCLSCRSHVSSRRNCWASLMLAMSSGTSRVAMKSSSFAIIKATLDAVFEAVCRTESFSNITSPISISKSFWEFDTATPCCFFCGHPQNPGQTTKPKVNPGYIAAALLNPKVST